MAKRKIDEILNESLPEASKELYQKKWLQFMEFMGEFRQPMETDYLQYFDYLHNEKKQKASTIWSTYSSLNSIHQRDVAEILQNFPKVIGNISIILYVLKGTDKIELRITEFVQNTTYNNEYFFYLKWTRWYFLF